MSDTNAPAIASDHHAHSPPPPPTDTQGPSTVPNPPTTPARTDTGFPQHRPHPFHSTPLKPSPNPWLVDPDTGKARRIGLVDDTGMGTRFHQLGLNTFNDIIPGELPTAEDRNKFEKPNISDKRMLESDIGVELTKTIKSILDAAGADHGLEVLHTPYHKARGDHGKPEDTVNDVGIYPTTEFAQRVTHLSKRDISRSTWTKSHLQEGSFGRRSWHWLAILGEVKSFRNPMCAFTMIPRSLQPPQAEAAPSEASNVDPLVSASPSQVAPSSVDLEDEAYVAPANAESTSAPSPEVEVGEPYINNTPNGELGLGQVAEYMLNLLTHQHRCFAYGFYVKWKFARLLYFDRTGALISEPFDWTEKTSLLHDFVWKVAHMTPEQLGYDPTAQPASELEIDLLRSKMGEELKALPDEVQQYVRNAFLCKATQPVGTTTTDAGDSGKAKSDKPAKAKPEVPLDEIPVYKLTVTSSDPSPDEAFPESPGSPPPTTSAPSGADATGERTFLVGRPHFAAESLIGRCTRGYIAFDLQDKIFCFLKDSWRPLVSGRSRPEHLVYERLRNRNVGRIASLVCGGDVGGHWAQVTRIQEDMPQEKKPVPRVHYRIVIEEIGVPLTEFRNFAELAAIFGHALRAHMAAYTDAGILHRDISVGNILIDPVSRSGILIDWDLSRLVSELGDGPMEPDRTGTWQFRSALSLYYPRKPYRLSDDVESFIHAFRYMVLRFHPTGLRGLLSHVQTYFEHSTKAGAFRLGGQYKMDHFDKDRPSFKVINNPKLQKILDEIARRCHHEFYNLVDMDLMELKYAIQTGFAEQVIDEEEPPSPSTPSDASDDEFLDRFSHLTTPTSFPQSRVLKVDACDIKEGFLSTQYHLLNLFRGFRSKLEDKHQDQFRARAHEEPPRFYPSMTARGVSNMSRSQTQDSSGHPASIAAPSTAATSPPSSPPVLDFGFASASTNDPSPAPSTSARTLRKRKDVPVVEGVAAHNENGNGEGPSSAKPKPKRLRKARS
ncbi:hypothetical protein LXA43DRAFT_384908 [Ganoderma leucocontextum]|nr:hypothetical protein LXA43DRAFT_384908 [Ganoderma leucocontextum]